MSYIDLSKLTMHRRSEMEKRIAALTLKCNEAVNNIENIKTKANSFTEQLNCDQADLKDRFLNCMQQLDEYSYLMTDFNLSFEHFESTNQTLPPLEKPVTDNETKGLMKILTPVNLLDALSDPAPSTSYQVPKQKTVKRTIKNKNKQDLLIDLSSASCSQESMKQVSPPKALSLHNVQQIDLSKGSPERSLQDIRQARHTPPNNMQYISPSKMITPNDMQYVNQPKIMPQNNESQSGTNSLSPVTVISNNVQDQQEIRLKGQDKKQTTNQFPQCFNIKTLPEQELLECDMLYKNAAIISASGCNLYFQTSIQDFYNLYTEMKMYYSLHKYKLTVEQLSKLHFCCFLDEQGTMYYYRAMVLGLSQNGDDTSAEVYLVDTGEVFIGPISSFGPLAPQFCKLPPLARACHLAGINISEDQKTNVEKYLKTFLGERCDVEIEDNNSETLGVYIHLLKGDKTTLNQHLVEKGFAKPDAEILNQMATPNHVVEPTHGPPPEDLDDMDLLDTPEYDDPLLAVTGYHNRDEAEICPHYKGGSPYTCFKGARCNKRHVLKDPDGWTLDRVQVVAKAPLVDLPAPGTWFQGTVTHVAYFDTIYLQIHDASDQEPTNTFGVMLPPRTFAELERDMNTPAARAAMKHLTMAPAPGELVAALYPLDGRWYRGRVTDHKPNEHTLQIFYVDYGNTMSVNEKNVRQLDPAYLVVPIQAVLCKIAGLVLKELAPDVIAQAKKSLHDSLLEKNVKARVISRGYDELEVELYDSDRYSVADLLIVSGVAESKPYKLYDDTHLTHRVVVP